MSLREDYKRDYAEFGGSYDEYRGMIIGGRVAIAALVILGLIVIWLW